MNETVERNGRKTYHLGSLLWARIGNYPYWPCMVSTDPIKGIFFRKIKSKKGEIKEFHVQFFGESTSRGWTSDIFPFKGKENYEAKVERETKTASNSVKKKLKKKYNVPSSYKKDWEASVSECEEAMQIRGEERYNTYVFQYDVNLKKTRKRKSETEEEIVKKVPKVATKCCQAGTQSSEVSILNCEVPIQSCEIPLQNCQVVITSVEKSVITSNTSIRCKTPENEVLVSCLYCCNIYDTRCIAQQTFFGSYICNDCAGPTNLPCGTIAWARTETIPWWPGAIVDPSKLPAHLQMSNEFPDDIPIFLFGSYEFVWVHRGNVFPFKIPSWKHCVQNFSEIYQNENFFEKFKMGVVEAQRYFRYKQNCNEEANLSNYKVVFANRAVHPAVIVNKPNAPCDCSPELEWPCLVDCINRLLNIECTTDVCLAGEKCQNQRFQARKYPPLQVFKTKFKGFGLKACQPIPEGTFILEYVGDVITKREFETRSLIMRLIGAKNYYFLYLDNERIIDAGPRGNLSRFINHSCNPNCKLEKWTVNGDLHIGIFALRRICPGEEITFHYGASDPKDQCRCMEPNCSGSVGAKRNYGGDKRNYGGDDVEVIAIKRF